MLGLFEKIYAPIFAALHEWLLELGGGRMLTPEELAPILDRWRGELHAQRRRLERRRRGVRVRRGEGGDVRLDAHALRRGLVRLRVGVRVRVRLRLRVS